MTESEPFPLLPGQSWFMADLHPHLLNPARWSLTRLYQLPAELPPATVRTAVRELWRRHEALRIRIVPAGAGWAQRVADAEIPAPYRFVDLSRVPRDEHRAEIERVCAEAHATLNLRAGPLVRFVQLHLGDDRPGRLLFTVHHLATDGLSFALVQSALDALLRTPAGAAPAAVPRAAAYRECVDSMVGYAGSDEFARELDHWAAQPWENCAPLPRDHPGHTTGSVRAWRTVRTPLRGPEAETLTQRLPGALGIDLSDIVLAAVSETLTAWSGGPLSVRTVHHGRTLRRAEPGATAPGAPVLPKRAARTVGWFSTFGLLALRPRTEPDPADYLRRVRDRATAAPNRGAGLPLLHWTRPAGAHSDLAARVWRSAQIMFNVGALGGRPSADAVLGAAPEASGHRQDPLEPHLPLHVRAHTAGDEVVLMWDYDQRLRREETVTGIAERCRQTLYEYVRKLG